MLLFFLSSFSFLTSLRLLSRVRGGLELMRLHVFNYVETVGKELVTADSGDKKTKVHSVFLVFCSHFSLQETFQEFVQSLLTFKNRTDVVVNECFNGDKLFQKEVAKAFEKFININDRTPQYLSLFVDDQLTRGLKGFVFVCDFPFNTRSLCNFHAI